MTHEKKHLLDRAILLAVCWLLSDLEAARDCMTGIDGRVDLSNTDVIIDILYRRVTPSELEKLQQLVTAADAAAATAQLRQRTGGAEERAVTEVEKELHRRVKQVTEEVIQLVRAYQTPHELMN